MINPILQEFLITPLHVESLGIMPSAVGDFNGLFVMSAFAVIFVVLLLLVVNLKSKMVKNIDRFDISYCGEIPSKKTPLHYGYSIGAEIHRISIVGAILKRSSSNFYEFLATQTKRTSELLSKMYQGNLHNTAIVILLFFATLFFIGVK
jgi:hypothetical protein